MPLEKTRKQSVVQDHARTEGDTGSPEVQIALMQARILQITNHLKTNKKDFHSLRGLQILVGRRRRLEGYLRAKDVVRYRELMKKLGIREVKPR
ncbi:MAG TPA: 30S ribosomal protein S15 [Fimbriimonadaceae bacterium]|nr:30S ribosomal protein S15 [Fimbriimonadaceae bacterium]